MEPALGVAILVEVDYFDHMKRISEHLGRITTQGGKPKARNCPF
jgi:hypothetical protein